MKLGGAGMGSLPPFSSLISNILQKEIRSYTIYTVQERIR